MNRFTIYLLLLLLVTGCTAVNSADPGVVDMGEAAVI
jgi:hypothetical protein